MFRCFNLLLLLFCLVYHSGNSSKPVSGKKGGKVTLTCEHEDNNIVQIDLFTRSRAIDVCQTEECSGRVFKEGNCDVVIKNLSFSDAGKYILRIYYNNDQTELTYQLHIHESGTESPEKLDDTEQHQNWIVSVGVCLVILAVIVISVIIWRRQHRDTHRFQQRRIQSTHRN